MRIPTVPLALLAACVIGAQDPPATIAPAPVPPVPTLENSGKPMVLPYQCTPQDISLSGLSCSEEDPCPIYLELSAAEASPGGRILAAGNIHSSAVTIYSVLLASEDAGHTWREVADRIRGAGLEHIQFADAEIGFVSGQELSPLPRDPFLLLTSDGGKTWRQRAVLNEDVENRFGTIQQFYFPSKSSGTLIVDRGPGSDGDRYALYESPDSGESWLIKEESNKPIRLKRPPPPSPGAWRVRVDGPSQSFHIERRQGERWISVAAFAVKLPGCKPPPLSDVAPPEEEKAAPPAKPVVIKK